MHPHGCSLRRKRTRDVSTVPPTSSTKTEHSPAPDERVTRAVAGAVLDSGTYDAEQPLSALTLATMASSGMSAVPDEQEKSHPFSGQLHVYVSGQPATVVNPSSSSKLERIHMVPSAGPPPARVESLRQNDSVMGLPASATALLHNQPP